MLRCLTNRRQRCSSKEGVRCHFECFGEILEVIVIAHKDTGRSKGGRFEAKPAIRACLGPYPVIDGQRANCNLACLGVQRSKAPQPTASKSICRHYWDSILLENLGDVRTLQAVFELEALLLTSHCMKSKNTYITEF